MNICYCQSRITFPFAHVGISLSQYVYDKHIFFPIQPLQHLRAPQLKQAQKKNAVFQLFLLFMIEQMESVRGKDIQQ